MRNLPTLFLFVLGSTGLSACGGTVNEGSTTDRPAASSPSGSTGGPATPDQASVTEGPATAKPLAPECAKAETVLVANGGTLTRSAGKALRLQLVYQGSSVGIREARGVDMILSPTDGPFSDNAGYWIETGSGSSTLYTRLLRDPTTMEAHPAPGGGGFANFTVPRCDAKTFGADVPNDPAATEIRIYGSPYGTQDRAVLLARFALK